MYLFAAARVLGPHAPGNSNQNVNSPDKYFCIIPGWISEG